MVTESALFRLEQKMDRPVPSVKTLMLLAALRVVELRRHGAEERQRLVASISGTERLGPRCGQELRK